jgi:hypothetical protein
MWLYLYQFKTYHALWYTVKQIYFVVLECKILPWTSNNMLSQMSLHHLQICRYKSPNMFQLYTLYYYIQHKVLYESCIKMFGTFYCLLVNRILPKQIPNKINKDALSSPGMWKKCKPCLSDLTEHVFSSSAMGSTFFSPDSTGLCRV